MITMAKDRNTFAKRQREMDRKRKAEEKRLHRAKRRQDGTRSPEGGQETEGQSEAEGAFAALSIAQRSVLMTFRQFRMTPGKMLCFSHADEITFRAPLSELAVGGYVVPEKFPGGYSLTLTGFAAMQALA